MENKFQYKIDSYGRYHKYLNKGYCMPNSYSTLEIAKSFDYCKINNSFEPKELKTKAFIKLKNMKSIVEQIDQYKGKEKFIPEYIEVLKRYMSNDLVFKFIRTNITHWLDEDFVLSRTFSLEYWKDVEKYFERN